MLRNFTAVDVVGTAEASLLLTMVLFIPGYVIGWLSDAFAFRERRVTMQLVLSTPLAVAVLPILVYLFGPYPRVLWTLFAASWFTFLALGLQIVMRRGGIELRRLPRALWIGVTFALAWAFLVIVALADFQFRGRLYFSIAAFDNSTRAAFTAAASRSIPAHNPFFATSPPALLRYHYFWMMVCSLITKLGNIPARYALYGGTVWAGIALMSLIVIALKFFLGVRDRLERKAVIACSLLLVTGLDILPTAYRYVYWHALSPDMEWWNEQITSWVDALVWTPHHLMSLVACMVGFLVLRQPSSTKYRRAVAILVAGLAFASSVGLSVLVSFTFAVFVVLWLPVAALQGWWDEAAGLVAAGALALAAVFPYLHMLAGTAVAGFGSGNGGGSGGFPVALQIRDFSFGMNVVGTILESPRHNLPFPHLLLLLFLPLNYFLELGFFFFVGGLRIRNIRAGSVRLTREEQTGWMIVATSLLIGSFLRSTTLAGNDLGWRCFLQTQFVLLLWGAVMTDEWWCGRHIEFRRRNLTPAFAGLLLAIGLIGTVYQVAMLRAYPILADAGKIDARMYYWLDQDHRLGERTLALRSVYDSLGAMLPPDAVVQYNPNADVFIPHQLYSGRNAAMGLQFCGVVFGGELSGCEGRMKSVAPLFDKPTPAESDDLDLVCRRYNIEIMLADDRDPVWKQHESWVWSRSPLIANGFVRAFACGDQSQQLRFASAH